MIKKPNNKMKNSKFKMIWWTLIFYKQINRHEKLLIKSLQKITKENPSSKMKRKKKIQKNNCKKEAKKKRKYKEKWIKD